VNTDFQVIYRYRYISIPIPRYYRYRGIYRGIFAYRYYLRALVISYKKLRESTFLEHGFVFWHDDFQKFAFGIWIYIFREALSNFIEHRKRLSMHNNIKGIIIDNISAAHFDLILQTYLDSGRAEKT
jgi:hypothetical protein